MKPKVLTGLIDSTLQSELDPMPIMARLKLIHTPMLFPWQGEKERTSRHSFRPPLHMPIQCPLLQINNLQTVIPVGAKAAGTSSAKESDTLHYVHYLPLPDFERKTAQVYVNVAGFL